MARRASGLRSRGSRTLSESGGSREFEDDAQEAMQEMLGAQEWHQVWPQNMQSSKQHFLKQGFLARRMVKVHEPCCRLASSLRVVLIPGSSSAHVVHHPCSVLKEA